MSTAPKRQKQARSQRNLAVVDLAAEDIRDETPPQPAPIEGASDMGEAGPSPAVPLPETMSAPEADSASAPQETLNTPIDEPTSASPSQSPSQENDTSPTPADTPDTHPRRTGTGGMMLASFIGALLGALATLAAFVYTGAGGLGGDARLASPQQDIARLDQARSASPTPGASEDRSALATAQDLASAREQVANLSRRLETLEKAPPSAATGADTSALMATIDSTRAATQDAQAKAAVALEAARSGASTASQAAPRIAALEQAVRNAPGAASARLTLATRLSDALAAGRPLTNELAALSYLGVAQDRLAPLSAISADGAGNASLAAAFRPVAADLRAREAASTAPAATGWVDRLWQWGTTLVRLRKVDAAITERNITLAAVEAALIAGRPREALRLWLTLPADTRTSPAASTWSTRLTARAKADETLEIISAEAITALGSGPR